MSSQSGPNIDYSPEMNSLSSIVHTFVQEHQEQLRSEMEYKKRMLILDATDHRFGSSILHFQAEERTGESRLNFLWNDYHGLLLFVIDTFSKTYLASDGRESHN